MPHSKEDLMMPDLRFSRGLGLEQGFRAQRIQDGYRTHWCTEAVRATAWTIAAVKAYIEGSRTAAAGLALGALSSAALPLLYALVNRQLALRPHRQLPLRLLYAAVIATNLLQCLLGVLFFHAIYPEGQAAEPPSAFARLRACMLAVMSCGVMWLVFYGRMSPLPFRYQWPQLTVAAAMMLYGTETMCSNSNLQTGHAELHCVLRHMVLPMLLPATAYSLPDTGGLHAGPGPEARALCQTHQPAVIVIGLTAVLLSIYQAEAQQRARLLHGLRQQQVEERTGQWAAGQQRPPASAHPAPTGSPSGPGGASASAVGGRGGSAEAAGAAAITPASSLGQESEDGTLSPLPMAAQQRMQVWLLTAAFVYILWSSLPATAGPLPPAVDGSA